MSKNCSSPAHMKSMKMSIPSKKPKGTKKGK